MSRVAIKFLKKWPGTAYNAGDVCVKDAAEVAPLVSAGIATPLGSPTPEHAVAGADVERTGRRGGPRP